MVYLQFEVKNMAVQKKSTDKTPLISGSVDYYGLQVEFDPAFSEIPGIKAVEFIKKNNKERRDLVDGKCAIPNWILTDKDTFQIRVVSGTTTGTQWQQVAITEGGIIMPEEPEEEAPPMMEYVKTQSGENAAPYLRADSNGLEFSKDGETWEGGVSGVPEVPRKPDGGKYVRAYGDWILQEETESGETNIIEEVKVNGEALQIENKSVNIDLSEYAKSTDIANEYATKAEVDALQTMTGAASGLEMLDYSETDTSTIVTKINEIITLLQARGIATS